jgi:WD40 repeat protein
MIVSMAEGGGVWKSSDGHLLAEVPDRVYSHQSICFTPDGKRFALWGGWPDDPRPITIHDISTGAASDSAGEMNAMDDDSGDGHFITSMSEDGEIHTRRVPDRAELCRIKAHAGLTSSCAFSSDTTLLVSSGADDMVKVRDWEAGVELFSADVNSAHPRPRRRKARSANADRARIRQVKFIDDHTIAAAIDTEQVVVWNFRTGELLQTVAWTGTLAEFPRQLRYRAEHRGDEIVIVDSETADEVAWFPVGRSLSSRLILVPHPNGRAWAGIYEQRLYHFVLE